MNKKGQVEKLQFFLLTLIAVAITLTVGLIVLAELQTGSTTAKYFEDVTASNIVTIRGMLVGVDNKSLVVADNNTIYTALTEMTPLANFSREINESFTATNASTSTLTYKLLVESTVYVQNASNGVLMGSGNYTFSAAAGTLVWKFIGDDLGQWNNSAVYVIYNKTWVRDTTDLTDLTTYCNAARTTTCYLGYHYQVNASSIAYGTNTGIKINTSTLTNTNWIVTYTTSTVTERTPTTAASNATGSIITKMATIPTWIGILIVVALAFAVLGFFYMRGQNY